MSLSCCCRRGTRRGWIDGAHSGGRGAGLAGGLRLARVRARRLIHTGPALKESRVGARDDAAHRRALPLRDDGQTIEPIHATSEAIPAVSSPATPTKMKHLRRSEEHTSELQS